MSWCASLGPAFWKGYRELIPKVDGFERRFALYEAYHQLNHYNLFGGGYSSRRVELLAQVGMVRAPPVIRNLETGLPRSDDLLPIHPLQLRVANLRLDRLGLELACLPDERGERSGGTAAWRPPLEGSTPATGCPRRASRRRARRRCRRRRRGRDRDRGRCPRDGVARCPRWQGRRRRAAAAAAAAASRFRCQRAAGQRAGRRLV